MLPKKLHKKLKERKISNAFRQLGNSNNMVDFSSNDYLGFSRSETIFRSTHQYLIDEEIIQNGSTGSRLLSGNHALYSSLETVLGTFHNVEAALVFNSGYDANLGLLSTIPQRNDVILYDELVHASIRDGIQMSHAKPYKFEHNDLANLETLLKKYSNMDGTELYVVTESVFSMDGDSPDLKSLVALCETYAAKLVIDEAHALGVHGEHGSGLLQELKIENGIFARIITFGKALGCHGAAVLGSQVLKDYLINFCRPFIYTTALPPHTLATLIQSYTVLKDSLEIKALRQNIDAFNSEKIHLGLEDQFIKSQSAIHCCIVPGNDAVKDLALNLQNQGFDVKPILSPTVSQGRERLRFCLHSYNSEGEISEVLRLLATFAFS